MKVVVNLEAGLERYAKSRNISEEVEIIENCDVKWLMNYYNFPPGEIGVIVVNKELVDEYRQLSNGDVIKFYPFFGGG